MTTDADVIIVGAGFGGLGLALRLERNRRTSYIILERASELGGTWRDNTYPGCACDIPAMLYSFSFEPRAHWTRIYPQQAEILAYLNDIADRTGLRRRIRFNSELSAARFDEPTCTWTVTLRDGTTLRGRALVLATGPLNKPAIPALPGRDMFAGPAFHSAQWDHRVDLHGKNVVVIGTGASAIQFVPEIAPAARRLTIFQRTPPWIIPRFDKPVRGLRHAARRIPLYAWVVRKAIYWTRELQALGFVVEPKLLERAERTLRTGLHRAIADPVLRAKVTPNYRAGCKRILISDDYYPALQRTNVELVTDAPSAIRAHSVVVHGGREIAADVLIYATGFRATEGIAPLVITGCDGLRLDAAWRDGMEAYLGTTVAGFPNLFFVIGPNTGLGHNSMIFMMEAQYRYIIDALAYGRRTGRAVDVKPDVMRAYNAELQRRMRRTVWATGCTSWYQDARGKNVSLWPDFTFVFRRRTARFDARNYRRIAPARRRANARRRPA